MTFRICHIGCGGMSVRGHGPALKKYRDGFTDTELAACCDLDIDKARVFAGDFGFIKAYSDWRKMLKEENPDAVSLVVPVSKTASMAVEILSMGYNLNTEKPPGMSPGECKCIIDASLKSGKKLGVMFNRRYMPIVKKMAEVLSDRKVDYLRYDFYRTGRKDIDFSTTAIHGIDTAQMLAGELLNDVSIEYQELDTTPVGNIFITGLTGNGTRVQMNFFPDSGMNGERVFATAEGFAYFLHIPIWDCPDYPGVLREYENGKQISEYTGELSDGFIASGFYDEHRDFYESIRKNGVSPADMKGHLRSVEIMEGIRMRKQTVQGSQ